MWTKAVMTKLRLSLNEAKTSIRDGRKERFEFLGYSFGLHYWCMFMLEYRMRRGERVALRSCLSGRYIRPIRTRITTMIRMRPTPPPG